MLTTNGEFSPHIGSSEEQKNFEENWQYIKQNKKKKRVEEPWDSITQDVNRIYIEYLNSKSDNFQSFISKIVEYIKSNK